MTIGEQFRKLRAEKGLSQPELAELSGIEQSYLSKLENDKSLPSNDIFRKLLLAFELTVKEFLSPLSQSYIENHLMVITDIEFYVKKKQSKNLSKQRKMLYSASLLIVVAVTVFYIGISKLIFNESLFEYRSDGVILAGEPNDIFWKWRDLIDSKDRNEKDELRRQQSLIMAKRSDVLVKLIPENKGYYFEMPVEGGSRLFTKAKHDVPLQKPRAINAWLQVLGVFLFTCGMMAFILEKRLFRSQ
jgi:transcriptional regulator with XRE-family HTH domain